MAKSSKVVSPATAPVPAKKAAPIDRGTFSQTAKSVAVQIGNDVVTALKKEFSTGSFGWYGNGKATVNVNGVEVPCQVGVNITVIGSKNGQ